MTTKPMTNSAKALSFISTKKTFTSKTLITKLGFSKQQARNTIYYLRKKGYISNTGKTRTAKNNRYQVYVFETVEPKPEFQRLFKEVKPKEITTVTFHRKILKATIYCDGVTAHRGQKHKIYAMTFEESQEPKRIKDLHDAIDDYASKHSCHKIDEFGYDNRKTFRFTPDSILKVPVFPEIEVEEE